MFVLCFIAQRVGVRKKADFAVQRCGVQFVCLLLRWTGCGGMRGDGFRYSARLYFVIYPLFIPCLKGRAVAVGGLGGGRFGYLARRCFFIVFCFKPAGLRLV